MLLQLCGSDYDRTSSSDVLGVHAHHSKQLLDFIDQNQYKGGQKCGLVANKW